MYRASRTKSIAAVAFAVTAACVVAIVGTPTARACSCLAVTPEQAFADAAAVFEARVLEVATVAGNEPTLRATVHVVRAWKGELGERAALVTDANSAACGFPLEAGRSYLIYAYRGSTDAWSVSLCGGSTRIEDAEAALAGLGAGVTPVDIEPTAAEQRVLRERERPARGGCASCTVADSRERAGVLTVGGLLALAALLRRRGLSRGRSGSRPSAA